MQGNAVRVSSTEIGKVYAHRPFYIGAGAGVASPHFGLTPPSVAVVQKIFSQRWIHHHHHLIIIRRL